jgi:ribose 1,5-bisphosphokinase
MTAGSSKAIGPGRFILVVGPSGGGKDTIIAGAKAACDGKTGIVFPRRIVTRKASAAEDHDSLDDAAFDRAVNDGSFAVWWQAHGLKYGIPRSANADIRAGHTVICNVSRAVVGDVRARYANVCVVLVTAPPPVLAARLAGRSRDSDGPLHQRLKRNDAFANFRTDLVIYNVRAAAEAVQQFLEVIND